MRKPFFARFAPWILVGILLLVPLLAWSASKAVQSNKNRVQDWLPMTFTETGELGWFRKHFVADQFVVVSWEGCELGDDPSLSDARPDDPRIEQLARLLVPDPESPGSGEYGKYFKSVNTARRVLNRMTAPPLSIPYREAVERLKGGLIGPDGRSTAVVVMLSDQAIGDMRSAIGRGVRGVLRPKREPGALLQALQRCGISDAEARLGGPPVDNVSIDEEGERTLVRLVLAAVALGVMLAWVSLQSLRLTVMVFGCGILSAMTSLAIVHLTGAKTDAVLMSMPSLVYILAISVAIHIINHYRTAVAEHGLLGAPERAVAHAWKPALLCNVTTAIGLGSLYTSEIVPIAKFGLYSAIGVMATLTILFTYLPSALQMWPPKPLRKKTEEEEAAGLRQPGFYGQAERFWTWFGRGVIRHHAVVATACILVTILVGYGLTRVHTSIDLLKLYAGEVRIRQDYAWLEKHLGRLVPMEIVLRFDPQAQAGNPQQQAAGGASSGAPLSFLERMETVALVQQLIEQEFGAAAGDIVGPSMSAATFGPTFLTARGETLSFAKRSVINARLEKSRNDFLQTGYFQIDPQDGSELWRVSLRIAAFQDVDYGRFSHDVRHTVEPVIAAHRARGEILDAIKAKRQTGRYAGATVFLWDRSDADAPGSAVSRQHQRVFAQSLRGMLGRTSLRVTAAHADPASIPVTQLERLRDFDCVVLVGGFSDSQVQMIRHWGGQVVDTRGGLASQVAAISGPQVPAAHPAPTGVAAVYTGVIPIVYKAQRSLLDSLIESSIWSFATITPLLMFVLRSPIGGALIMLPNVVPVLFIFGGMGWLGVYVDIGSMMAASIALGVAVDDTIHFMTWYRDHLDRLGDRKKAILAAYRLCATPTTQAAIVNGLGLSVFALSTFMPTRKFGGLMLVILVAGWVAELLLVPALLAGPLGAVFRPRRRKDHRREQPAAAPEPALPLAVPRACIVTAHAAHAASATFRPFPAGLPASAAQRAAPECGRLG